MGASISRKLKWFLAKRDMKILMLGLDASGKTTILYKLKLGDVVAAVPTTDRFGHCGDITLGIPRDSFSWWTAMIEEESQKLEMSCIRFWVRANYTMQPYLFLRTSKTFRMLCVLLRLLTNFACIRFVSNGGISRVLQLPLAKGFMRVLIGLSPTSPTQHQQPAYALPLLLFKMEGTNKSENLINPWPPLHESTRMDLRLIQGSLVHNVGEIRPTVLRRPFSPHQALSN
ncbi:uncharacterized protein LOC131326804 isoform X1 [Rhododendron vialii]|uniref:uncharacterized protein LOC131326804 isoform X1 n=1 Tax=Rhododendron vialii TaxID=182163 RepID=UPI00265ED134|nr:uncharacterized protein LOC131326804 isoform X1 [Rhododendron vialii]XP_058215672.1 uncharacterized protein LOC131326804 isoform X1 [Rhododendron vialii]XP_058215673.1 uncharacterized protein LOC131326804 isoform X1 [Rhododendron vialii]